MTDNHVTTNGKKDEKNYHKPTTPEPVMIKQEVQHGLLKNEKGDLNVDEEAQDPKTD